MFLDNIVHEFGEITQNKGHYAAEDHSRSPILEQIDFLLVININVPPILHRFRNVAFNRSKIATFRYPLRLIPPMERIPTSSPEVIYR